MNKGIVIGAIAIVVVAIIIGVVGSSDLESYDEPLMDNIKINESSPLEEIVIVPEKKGRELSVELIENVGISSSRP